MGPWPPVLGSEHAPSSRTRAMNGVPLGNDPRVRVSHLSSLVEETRSIGPMVQDLLGKREQEALPYKIRVSYTYSIPPFFPDRPALDPNVFFAGSFIRFSRCYSKARSIFISICNYRRILNWLYPHQKVGSAFPTRS